MALFDVCGLKSYCDIRRQILPTGQTHLIDRTSHYSFGAKTQEFAVPLGVDVSIIHDLVKINGYPNSTLWTYSTRAQSVTRWSWCPFTRLWFSGCDAFCLILHIICVYSGLNEQFSNIMKLCRNSKPVLKSIIHCFCWRVKLSRFFCVSPALRVSEVL